MISEQNNPKLETNISFFFYVISFCGMSSLSSLGFTSSDYIYKVFFLVFQMFLFLSAITQRYSISRFFLPFLIIVFLVVNYLISSELTVLLSFIYIAVFGYHLNYESLLKYTFYVKLISTITILLLVYLDIVPQEKHLLPKDFIYYYLDDLGYSNPNAFFANVFSIVLLYSTLNFYKKSFYLTIFISSIILYFVYTITMCRSGFVCWFIYCLFSLYIIHIKFLNKYIFRASTFSCGIFFIVSVLLSRYYLFDNELYNRINELLTGRLYLWSTLFSSFSVFCFWGEENLIVDNMYIKLLFSYGLFFLLLVVLVHYKLYCYLYTHELYSFFSVLVVYGVYGLVEQFPLNIFLNPFLILFSLLFTPKRERNMMK